MFTKTRYFKALIAIFGIVATFAIISSFASAQGWGCCRGNNESRWSNANVPEKYWLTTDQRSQIRDIWSEYESKILPIEKELNSMRIEAQGYTSRSGADVGKIKSYRTEIRNLEDKIQDLRLDNRGEINKILTKEQRVYFGDNYDWWNMDHDRMGNMGDSMGTHDDCSMMSDRWGW
ncbi:MAG: hypothetical protein HZB59_10045 [Ignavibacteriales bacterium]|nr:hypothetical protein [Ignavibacteriales bacterium]